nr:hypothetical protein [Tanacetum cinerariifolium]
MQTNQFTGAVFAIPGIIQHYMDQRMNASDKVAVQIQSDRLCDEAQRKNDKFLRTAVNEQLETEVLTRSCHSSRTSYAVAADLSEMELKNILIEKIEGNKSIQCLDEQRKLYKALFDGYESDKIILDTYGETVTLKRRRDDNEDKDKEPSAGLGQGSKRRREGKKPESASAPSKTATRSAGMSSIGVDTLTPELLDGPTYELINGSCKSLIELEYHLEEVYKATTDQLDWVNPEGQQYPHNLLQPLPLIPDNRGRHVIPFEHFINNDLEYLHVGTNRLRQACPLGSLPLTGNLLAMYIPREESLLSWNSRKSDKERAAAMIQAINKRLKTRMIMRSLERFVGGRLYEEDFCYKGPYDLSYAAPIFQE